MIFLTKMSVIDEHYTFISIGSRKTTIVMYLVRPLQINTNIFFYKLNGVPRNSADEKMTGTRLRV